MSITPRKPKVAVFHPGTQHSYHTAGVLQDAGMLAWYATEIFTDPARWPYRMLCGLPGRVGQRFAREFSRRYDPHLDPALVRARGSWEYLESAAIRLHLMGLARWFNVRGNRSFGRMVGKMVRREPPDLLWGFVTSSRQAFAMAREAGVGCILDYTRTSARFQAELIAQEARLSPPEWPLPALRNAEDIEREAAELELSDLVLAGSDFVRSTIAPEHQHKTIVCPYGVDVSRFSPVEREAPEVPTVLYVGAISARKGSWYLLEACRQVHRHTPLRLVLVGALEAKPEALAPYADFVTHVPHVPYAEIHRQYQQADIFIQPSLYEGLSRVMLEAAATQLPLIVTPNTGATTVFDEGSECKVVPIRDAAALAAALAELLADSALRRGMGERARQKALQYTWERYGAQAIGIVEQLMSDRRGQACPR